MAKILDLTGKIFKYWKVIKLDLNKKHNKKSCWVCECTKCHKITTIKNWEIRFAKKSSCECDRNNDELMGQKFNSLTIIKNSKTKGKKQNNKYIICKCDCGNEREFRLCNVISGRTKSCGCACYKKDENGHSLTRKRKTKHSNGYIRVYYPTHPDANKRGHIAEHRLVMEQHLGRRLTKTETIHHINGKRDDNRLENLELWASGHPRGQRIEDLITYAKEILTKYDNYQNPTKQYFQFQIIHPNNNKNTSTGNSFSENKSNTITVSSNI